MISAKNLPAPLTNGELIHSATLDEVPSAKDLQAWLEDKGLDTKDWGQGNTKEVGKFWKEIKLNEAGLELWKCSDGALQPVRVTHVLRARVSCPERYDRQIFLFNTWQQYGDGRTRTRNGLLSEKLTVDEMPLEDNLHDVCQRAVTEEEMQRVVESSFQIGPGTPAPEYDPDYVCPLEVVDEHFIDHIIEVEKSKSYPGLLTMYHLYTVDIICTGLPLMHLNTLEFDHPDANGHRKLKYIHAWEWMEWPQIQRYLVEGSELKETKRKGSFADAEALRDWLSQFNLELSDWGQGTFKPISALWKELEHEDSQIELWGRHDGVPLLMRVTHVLQLKIISASEKLRGKFLFCTSTELSNGSNRVAHTLPAMKLSLKDIPYDVERFRICAEAAIKEQLTYIVDMHYRMDPARLPDLQSITPQSVVIDKLSFIEERKDVEESPSYRGLFTMYHLYCMEAECTGLPDVDFAALEVKGKDAPISRKNWSWHSAQKVMDIMRHRSQSLVRQQAFSSALLESVRQESGAGLERLSSSIQELCNRLPKDDPQVLELLQQTRDFQQSLHDLLDSEKTTHPETSGSTNSASLPPSMLATMEKTTLTSEKFLEEAQWKQVAAAKAKAQVRRTSLVPNAS
eukprot:TRINITY_DN47199_c0_g1_i1.p1 TRINITY_DN47199_c0_g1~~TRINITY_DN47199_c0_g1_i1.p1  ORF type:complete len:626 (-),score=118.70 TRINITY_DN47199_c0_g1_i1:196-2073(-)